MSFNPVEELITALNEGRNVFLTGAGGTGKSFLLKGLLKKYPNQFVVTSSTGISASLLLDGAMTIHSFSGIGIRSIPESAYNNKKEWDDYCLNSYLYLNEKQRERIRGCKRLIIDEVSMISKGQLDLIDQVLRHVKGEDYDNIISISKAFGSKENFDESKNPSLIPFGGIQVIITGDFLQLPAIKKINLRVIENNPIYFGCAGYLNDIVYSRQSKSHFIKTGEKITEWKELSKEEYEKLNEPEYAFESRVWEEANLKLIYLKEIKRTDNKEFAEFLHKLRIGKWSTEDFFYLKKFKNNIHTCPPVKLFARNSAVDKYNNEQLALVDKPLITLKAKWRGDQDELRELKKGILAPDTLELKEGCRVMIVVNKPEEDSLNDVDYVNGSTGVFLGVFEQETRRRVWIIEKDPITGEMRKFKDHRVFQVVSIKLDNGNTVSLRRKSWNNGIKTWNDEIKEEVYDVEFQQFPIRLAYSLTSHKSQGASIDFLEIDTDKFQSPNQFYVALSRATDPNKIKIVNLKTFHIKTCPKALEFYNKLEKNSNEVKQ